MSGSTGSGAWAVWRCAQPGAGPQLEFAHTNEINGDAAVAAHVLTFDSVHGRWAEDVQGDGEELTIQGTRLGYSSAAQPSDVPWGELGVEVVLDGSGCYRNPAILDVLSPGVRKVIVAAPVKGEALNVVVGVNDHLYDPERVPLSRSTSRTIRARASWTRRQRWSRTERR